MNFRLLTLIMAITLAAVALVQFLYITWLAYALRRQRPSRYPDMPVMPTNPQYDVPDGSIGKMIVLRGLPNLAEILLPSNEFGIGRFYNPDNNILVALDERSISRRHATFLGDESTREYYLTDTHSSYGTRIQVEGRLEPLTPGRGQRIYHEDVVQFGNAVTLRFVLPCQTRPKGAQLY